MKQEITVKHEFVQFIPEELQERTIYISIHYATVSHLCACGCENKVVTPLKPTDWKLTFDGKTISLHPSIGNWSFPCRSHYWISNNKVQWAEEWSQSRIDAGRAYDRRSKERYFSGEEIAEESALPPKAVEPTDPAPVSEAKPAWWKAWWPW